MSQRPTKRAPPRANHQPSPLAIAAAPRALRACLAKRFRVSRVKRRACVRAGDREGRGSWQEGDYCCPVGGVVTPALSYCLQSVLVYSWFLLHEHQLRPQLLHRASVPRTTCPGSHRYSSAETQIVISPICALPLQLVVDAAQSMR